MFVTLYTRLQTSSANYILIVVLYGMLPVSTINYVLIPKCEAFQLIDTGPSMPLKEK